MVITERSSGQANHCQDGMLIISFKATGCQSGSFREGKGYKNAEKNVC